MVDVTDTAMIAPGVYEMSAAEYHADPVPGGSLSSSGARKLLAPSCPALYQHSLAHPQPPRKEFDLGHAVHTLVLGVGAQPVLVDEPRWDTADTKARLREIRAAGDVPLKAAEYDLVHAMAGAVLQHPTAGWLFAPGSGEPEQAYIWRDEVTGIWCRALLDWSRPGHIVDLKTTSDPSPEGIRKSVHDFGYHQQQSWYQDAQRAVDGIDPEFTFVFVGKQPPHLVTVVRLTPDAVRLGGARNLRARLIYADCQRTGVWPGYGDDTHYLSLPPWAESRDAEEYL